jgi:hypothetical protein
VAAGIILFFSLFFLLNKNNHISKNIALNHTELQSIKSVININKNELAEAKSVKKFEIKKTNINQSEVAVISESSLIRINTLKATQLAVNNNDYFSEKVNPLTIDEVTVTILDADNNNFDMATSELLSTSNQLYLDLKKTSNKWFFSG